MGKLMLELLLLKTLLVLQIDTRKNNGALSLFKRQEIKLNVLSTLLLKLNTLLCSIVLPLKIGSSLPQQVLMLLLLIMVENQFHFHLLTEKLLMKLLTMPSFLVSVNHLLNIWLFYMKELLISMVDTMVSHLQIFQLYLQVLQPQLMPLMLVQQECLTQPQMLLLTRLSGLLISMSNQIHSLIQQIMPKLSLQLQVMLLLLLLIQLLKLNMVP